MAFITERTRVRAMRRAESPAPAEPSRWPALAGLALRRRLTAGGPWLTAAAAAATLLAGLALARPADPQTTPGTAYLNSQLTLAGGAARGAQLPNGLALQPADQRPAPLLTAALAADLWQANNVVFQAGALAAAGTASPSPAATATTQPTAPAGPTLDDLLRAQARLATAQLVYQALQQRATDTQVAAAQNAVAQAQAQIEAARQAVQVSLAAVSPSATPAPTAAPPTDADLFAAQQDVVTAQAAYTAALHPHTDDEIATARNELADAQAALTAARAVAVRATPAPTVAAAPSPEPTAAALPTAAPTAPPLAPTSAPIPTGFGGSTAVLNDPNTGVAGAQGAGSAAGGGGVVLVGGSAFSAPVGVAGGGAPAAPAPTAAPAASPPAAALAIATPVPTAGVATPPAATPGEAARSAAPAPPGGTFLAQQRVEQAQRTLALLTAPPNPADVQAAANTVADAQAKLDALAASANATPAPEPAATPSSTPVSAPPLTPAQQLAQAQAAYTGAVQQLQTLSAGPDDATLQAARDEYAAAEQALQSLMASADRGVAAQVDPDPQHALLRYSSGGATSGLTDIRAFIWPAHGPITSVFGPTHPLGIDIAQAPGLPVTAAASGVVSFSGGDPCCNYGYYVDIIHPGGYLTRYGHLLTPSFLKPGDKVNQGQLIGISGSTGFSTGPHVHFEIRFNNVPLDPLKLLAGLLPRPLLP